MENLLTLPYPERREATYFVAMPTITIHVSRFTKRIFERRYGHQQPYQITRSDALYNHLCAEPLRQNNWCATKVNKLLTESIQIKVTDRLARRMKAKNRTCFIGEHLHKIFQEKMLTFVQAQVLADLPAQRALKNFLSYYGIESDDYSLETAYAAWQRHKRKFLPKNSSKSAMFWGGSSPQKQAAVAPYKETLPMPVETLVEIVSAHFNQTADEVTGNCEAAPYYRKVLAWALSNYTHLTYKEMQSIIPKHISRLSRYINEINFQAQHYPNVKQDLKQIRAAIEAERTKMQAID